MKEIPAEGGAVLYLDSFDQVRMVDNTLRAIEEGIASPEHEQFRAACLERGLPLNASKARASWGHPRRSPRWRPEHHLSRARKV